jgi:uncharacterized protein YdaU (DUF1376 family)
VGKLKWYKRDPVAALEGMAELSLEECGAYNRILDLMYAREGNVPDNDIAIARVLKCDPRKWRKIRATLIRLGKLFLNNGKLHNKRADIEIDLAIGRLEKGLDNLRCTATSRQPSATSSMADIPKRTKKQSLSGVTTTTRVPPGGAPPKGGTASFTILNGGEENHGRRPQRLSPNNQTIRAVLKRRRGSEQANGGNGDNEID